VVALTNAAEGALFDALEKAAPNTIKYLEYASLMGRAQAHLMRLWFARKILLNLIVCAIMQSTGDPLLPAEKQRTTY